MAIKRFVCIHGHFYQPPRENPWLETVETQESAAPHHDWNERICAECYATNGAARIVNSENRITRIVNNYARMSFNFGPTLLSWLADNAPRAYRAILDGDRQSRKLHGGHSAAMAQVYNHVIMPLANTRDRLTQIRWGIADYQARLGIAPEGMWLAETAADTATLELLAENGIKFTLLAPHQAKRIRPLRPVATRAATSIPPSMDAGQATKDTAAEDWIPTPNLSVDTTRPYLVRFSSGHSLAVFFYNGPISRAIAFEGLLNSGENFAARLKTGFRDTTSAQLVHVATDGESYGHHHKHGEMALAYALRLLGEEKDVALANYGSYLAQFPPEYEAEIEDNTSWSCAHGIERWRSNCGCNGGKPDWSQAWRKPLRDALDALRDATIPLTERLGATLFRDVWAARDGYIQVILDRGPESIEAFLATHQSHALTPEERVSAMRLMELQRHAQLMYTSCGWFFDDISGIETVQIIAYAARVLQLASQLFGSDAPLEERFLAQLALAPSNVASAGDGARIYRDQILPQKLTLPQVAAHYAISSVFSSYPDETELFCFHVRRISYALHTSGRGRLAVGRARIESGITGSAQSFCFAVLHFGDQNITAAIKPYSEEAETGTEAGGASETASPEQFDAFSQQTKEQVERANFPEVIRLIDRFFGHTDYSLASLFRDEQHRIVSLILKSTLSDIEKSLSAVYEDHASLLHYLTQANLPKPPALTLAASFAVNAGLRHALEADPIDLPVLRSYLSLAQADQIELDSSTLSYIADQRMKRAMLELQMSLGSAQMLDSLDRARTLALALNELPFEQNLWQAQNIWHEIFRTSQKAVSRLDPAHKIHWVNHFNDLGNNLSIATSIFATEEPGNTAAPRAPIS